MGNFLQGTPASAPVSTDSADKAKYLVKTTTGDGAGDPKDNADIAAPKTPITKKDYLQVKTRIRNGKESEITSEQKVCQDASSCSE